MIKPSEIQRLARKDCVRDTQIEKDYILSWILTGVSKNDILHKALAFKGGTVLKKFYFEDYRYSEDLDFTLVDNSFEDAIIKDAFMHVFEYVKDEVNISLELTDFGEYETETINFYIAYIGPLGGNGTGKRVKVDISRKELLLFDTEEKSMFGRYTDHIETSIKCYSPNEILTEKMRSLLSRQQPRDYYDLWYLSEIYGLEMCDVISEYVDKAHYKNLHPENLYDRLEKLLSVFKSRWAGSMKDQIAHLPEFERVSRELNRHFRKVFKEMS